MYSFSNRFLVVMLVYILASFFGELLATPFGYSSFIWPAAGVALFFVLHWGYTTWPAIFIASIVASLIRNYLDGVYIADVVFYALSLSFMAFAVVIAAVLPAMIYSSMVSWPNKLKTFREITLLVLVGGFLGGLISSTMIVGYFYSANALVGEDVLYAWFLWWCGETIGVVSVTPLLLIMSAKEGGETISKHHVLTPMLCSLAVLVAFFVYLKSSYQTTQASAFQHDVDNIYSIVNLKLHKYHEANRAVQAFYNASVFVDRQEFDSFTAHLLDDNEGIKAMFWLPRVHTDNIPVFQQNAKLDGIKFTMTELYSQGHSRLSVGHEIYFPIFYIYPFIENKELFGLNLGADKEYRRALLFAEDGDVDIATRVIQHQNRYIAGDTLLFFVFSPVFEGKDIHENELRGFVGGMYDLNRVFETLHDYLYEREKTIKIYERDAEGNYHKFYETKPNHEFREASFFTHKNNITREYEASKEMDVIGRTWRIDVTQPKWRYSSHLPLVYVVTMIFGVVYMSLLGILVCGTQPENDFI